VSDQPGAEPPRPRFRHRTERRGLVGPFSGRQLVLAGVSVGLVAVVLVAVTTPLGETGSRGPGAAPTAYIIGPATEGLAPGQQPPDFTATRSDGSTFQLTDLDGDPIRLADLKGKAVWVNFWASWCPPCQKETPTLRDLADTYRDRGLEVVGISVQETNVDDVRAYAERYELDYTIAADLRADILHAFRVWAIPTQFFITPGGVISAVVQGPLEEPAAVAQIEAILPAD
jgi:peroxiredoxin